MNYLTGAVLTALLIGALATCPQGCAECDPSFTVCFACKQNLEANVFGQCQNTTIPHCIIYSPTGQCFNCQPTYRLENNACVKDYTGCVLSNSHDGSCFECGFSTLLVGTSCSGVLNCLTYSEECSHCRDGYQLNNNICVDVREGCNHTRPKDGICAECKEEYQYVGYQCISKNVSVPRCYIYNAEGKCKICKNGYNLFDHKCLLSFQIQAYIVAQDAGTAHTFGFTDQGFVEGGYVQPITIHNQNIQQDNIQQQTVDQQPIEHCQVPDLEAGVCLICVYGYYPAGNTCNLVSPLCNGHNIETGQCLDCHSTLLLLNGQCIDENCLENSMNGCLQCKQGWVLNDLLICVYDDVNCVEGVSGRCDKCMDGYFVHASGRCEMLPPNCAFANFQNGACLECQEGYQINLAEGSCENKPEIANCKVIDPITGTKCIICEYGWYPAGNQCNQVSPLCKDHNVQTGECISCNNDNLVVSKGKCVDGNCQTFDNNQCIACKQNYRYDEATQLCKYGDVNCEKQAGQSCLVCNVGFYINLQQRCIQLPASCQTAFPNGYCSECVEGYEIGADGECLETITIVNCLKVDTREKKCLICDNRYYVHGGVCARVSEGCQGYHPATGECFTCKLGYTMSNQQCLESVPVPEPPQQNITPNIPTTNTTTTTVVPPAMVDPNCRSLSGEVCIECSQRYYLNEDGKCVPVNPLCRDHNMQGDCTECYQGYALSGGKCLLHISTDPNCKDFQNQQCTLCYNGFFLQQASKLCKRLNPLCKTSDLTNGKCTSCYPGYSLRESGNCEIFFRDPNCRQFVGESQCVQCAPRYWLHPGGKCSPVNPLCNQFDARTGSCVTCYPGYVISGGKCVEGTVKDPNCDVFDGDYCTVCYIGYYSKNGQCRQANPLCNTFDSRTGECTTCYPGYQLQNGNCSVGVPKDPHCKTFDSNDRCAECYQGYLPINGQCEEQNPICKTIDYSNGHCETCWPGYVIFGDTCVVEVQVQVSVNEVTDIYCVRRNGSICEECSSGYYYNQQEGMCKSVDPLCKTYDNNDGRCTDCYVGYSLINGLCIIPQVIQIPNCLTSVGQICTECLQSFYFSDGQCKIVSILCASYDRTNGQCTSCISNHALQEGKCIYPALFDVRCVWYDNAFCSRCQDGYFVSNYMCQPIDRNCIQFNQQNRKCQECANGLQPSGLGCA